MIVTFYYTIIIVTTIDSPPYLVRIYFIVRHSAILHYLDA